MLAEIASSKEIIPTRLTFVDIAGLVRGASKGEGLGNQFLANIRECDAIAHVVRCFEDGDVTHVEGRIDPDSDIETVETELMLADLESLERRAPAMEKSAKGGDKEAKEIYELVERSLAELREGRPARAAGISRARSANCSPRSVCSRRSRCSTSATSRKRAPTRAMRFPTGCARGRKRGAACVVVSAKIESEIAVLPRAEQMEYLEAVGLTSPASTASSAPATRCCISSPSLPSGLRKRAPGRSRRARAPRRRRASSTPTSKKVLFAPRLSPMTIMSRAKAKRARAKWASSGSKARTTSLHDGDVLHFRFAN